MPLPPHDEQPLPSRRALREAERARAAVSGALPTASPAAPAAPPVVPPPAPGGTAVVDVVDVADLADLADLPATEHLLEGGDDAWVPDVVPRPTPLASRALVEDPQAVPAGAPDRAGTWRRLPQLLVVGSLVAVTIAYASAGDTVATAGEVRAFERAEQPVRAAAVAVVPVVEDEASAMVAGEDGLLRVQGDEASRGGERSVLPGCDGVPPETPQANGRIDETYLCTLWDGRTEVRADAAVSLTLLNERYRAHFGQDICLTDGYRSYAAQVDVRARKPGLAARPGTSEHGFGLAVDMCGGVESQGEGYWWLRENAAAFGYENPRWAQSGGGGPFEPWHWEYVAGQW